MELIRFKPLMMRLNMFYGDCCNKPLEMHSKNCAHDLFIPRTIY